jgi:uncharacterized protein (TIGR02147 family)
MSIFTFDDYRTYLRFYIESLPKKGWGFASRAAEAIGVQPAYFSLVQSGEKVFTPEQAIKLAKHLSLNEIETEYFLELVQLERAGNDELKSFHKSRVERLKADGLKIKNHIKDQKPLSVEEQMQFYSNSIYTAIRALTSIGDGKTFDEIQKHFNVPPLYLKEIMEFLVRCDLCFRKGDRYFRGAQKTWAETGTPAYFKHLTNWRLQGIRHLELNRASDKFVTMPMTLSTKDMKVVMDQIITLVRDINERVKNTDPQEEMVCLNIDFFRF